jgi:TolB-like protein
VRPGLPGIPGAARALLGAVLCASAAAGQTTVAVGAFVNRTDRFHLESWTWKIPDYLAAAWSGSGDIAVVDRSRLREVLEEKKLTAAAGDTTGAVEIGRLLSADYWVTGGVSETATGLRIDAAVTSTATGRLVTESVTAHSADRLGPMVSLLAGNLRVRLTGRGERRDALLLRRAPTRVFLGATLATGAAACVLHGVYAIRRNEYRRTTSLSEFDEAYRSANRWYRARNAGLALTGAALTGALACFLNDLDPDRVVAEPLPGVGLREGGVSFGLRFPL